MKSLFYKLVKWYFKDLPVTEHKKVLYPKPIMSDSISCTSEKVYIFKNIKFSFFPIN